MHVTSVESTELFTGPPDEPLQVVRVSYRFCSKATPVRVDGPGLQTVGEVIASPRGRAVECRCG
jgi:alpha-mannosidase